MHWFGRGDSCAVVCAYGLLTTRADKEFYSAHWASSRSGAQCVKRTRLTASRPPSNIHLTFSHFTYYGCFIFYNFSLGAGCTRVRYRLLIPCLSLAV